MLIVSLTHPTLIRVRYCSPRSQLGLIGIHKHNHVVIGLHTFPQEQTSVCGRYQPFDGYIVAFIHLRVGKGDVVSHDLLDSRLHISHNSPQSCQCLVIVPSAQVPTQRDCSFTIKKNMICLILLHYSWYHLPLWVWLGFYWWLPGNAPLRHPG